MRKGATPTKAGGCGTPRATRRATPPPFGEPRQRRKRFAPVFPLSAGAVRVSRIITKNPRATAETGSVVCYTPPAVFVAPPSVGATFRSAPSATPAATPEQGRSGRERGASRARLWPDEPARRPGHIVVNRAATVLCPGRQFSECRVARVRLTDVPPYVANSRASLLRMACLSRAISALLRPAAGRGRWSSSRAAGPTVFGCSTC